MQKTARQTPPFRPGPQRSQRSQLYEGQTCCQIRSYSWSLRCFWAVGWSLHLHLWARKQCCKILCDLCGVIRKLTDLEETRAIPGPIMQVLARGFRYCHISQMIPKQPFPCMRFTFPIVHRTSWKIRVFSVDQPERSESKDSKGKPSRIEMTGLSLPQNNKT